jgi:hypothetical protein
MFRLLPVLHALLSASAPATLPVENTEENTEIVAQLGTGSVFAGVPVSGALAPGDTTLNSGEFVDWYTLSGTTGQQLRVEASSADFDTYILVRGAGLSLDNDDRPDGTTNSLLDITLPAAASYQVGVTSYRPGETGAYTLAITNTATLATQPQNVASAGSLPTEGAVFGTLDTRDSRAASRAFQESWTLRGDAGTRTIVTMRSAEFDTTLQIAGPSGFIASNDDAPGLGTNSRLDFVFPASGEYVVTASSYSVDGLGTYSIDTARPPLSATGQTATSLPMPGGTTTGRTATSLPMPGGQTAGTTAGSIVADGSLQNDVPLRGELNANDSTRTGGQFVRAYSFEGVRGERISVGMQSDAFDTFLTVRSPSGMEETNDDRGDGTLHSLVSMHLAETGTYQVLASSYALAATGPFELRLLRNVENAPSGPQPTYTGTTLQMGGTTSGALAGGDATLGTGEFYDDFVLQGTAGTGVTITMESATFDTYLMIRGPGALSRDNDDSDGTNSRLEVTFPETGTYQVTATSYAPGEQGAYTIRVEEGTTVQRSVRGQVYAVFAGITNYTAFSPLAYCAEDAVKLNESLANTGTLASQSIVLTDEAVTVDGLRRAFERVAERAGPDDLFLFFYSGHGVQVANPDEMDGSDEALALIDGNVTDDELNSWLEPVNARMSLIVLDSCFSGGFARDVISQPNRMGIFSSEEDVTSNVAERFAAGGYVSYFLRNGLEGAADSDPVDGIVTAGELTQYLRRQWAQHMMNEGVETSDGEMAYQNLVIDRGAVKVSDIVMHGLPLMGSAR